MRMTATYPIIGGGGSSSSHLPSIRKTWEDYYHLPKTVTSHRQTYMWCHVTFGVMNPFWRAMLNLLRDVAVKMRKRFPACFRCLWVTVSGRWQRLVRSSTLFPFPRNYTIYGLFIHFLTQEIRQLKENHWTIRKGPRRAMRDHVPQGSKLHLLARQEPQFRNFMNYMYSILQKNPNGDFFVLCHLSIFRENVWL